MKDKRIHFSKAIVLQVLLVLLLLSKTAIFAEVKLPAIIGDNMVLQQGKQTPIWGWAEPGEKVTVSGSWHG
jgi:sialate O-acetylesterase